MLLGEPLQGLLLDAYRLPLAPHQGLIEIFMSSQTWWWPGLRSLAGRPSGNCMTSPRDGLR